MIGAPCRSTRLYRERPACELAQTGRHRAAQGLRLRFECPKARAERQRRKGKRHVRLSGSQRRRFVGLGRGPGCTAPRQTSISRPRDHRPSTRPRRSRATRQRRCRGLPTPRCWRAKRPTPLDRSLRGRCRPRRRRLARRWRRRPSPCEENPHPEGARLGQHSRSCSPTSWASRRLSGSRHFLFLLGDGRGPGPHRGGGDCTAPARP